MAEAEAGAVAYLGGSAGPFSPPSSIGLNGIDGVSLTVNGADDVGFHVAIIPHTLENTAFDALQIGSRVNLEIDTLARYVKRLLETEGLAS